MNNTILIPTYSEHFHFNINFLNSADRYCYENSIPHIFFVVSTKEEANQLKTLIEPMKSTVKRNVFVLDVESDFNDYNDRVKSEKIKADSSAHFLNGRSGIVNFKKLSGLDKLFSLGYENVIVLDSEVLIFREVNLIDCLSKHVDADIYRYSLAANNHELMTKIQYDSIRSVVRYLDSRHIFSRSYGWYENLCIYNNSKFYLFLLYLSDCNDHSVSKAVSGACNLKSAAFEWISYMAFRILVMEEEIEMSCVDEIITSQFNGEIIMNPQNENLYQYLTGDESKDSAFLSLINPPWVPYTENSITKVLLKKSLPDSCCLMFHVDRRHPGVEEYIPEALTSDNEQT